MKIIAILLMALDFYRRETGFSVREKEYLTESEVAFAKDVAQILTDRFTDKSWANSEKLIFLLTMCPCCVLREKQNVRILADALEQGKEIILVDLMNQHAEWRLQAGHDMTSQPYDASQPFTDFAHNSFAKGLDAFAAYLDDSEEGFREWKIRRALVERLEGMPVFVPQLILNPSTITAQEAADRIAALYLA